MFSCTYRQGNIVAYKTDSCYEQLFNEHCSRLKNSWFSPENSRELIDSQSQISREKCAADVHFENTYSVFCSSTPAEYMTLFSRENSSQKGKYVVTLKIYKIQAIEKKKQKQNKTLRNLYFRWPSFRGQPRKLVFATSNNLKLVATLYT